MGISSQTCSYLLSYAWGKLSSVANLSLSCFSSSRFFILHCQRPRYSLKYGKVRCYATKGEALYQKTYTKLEHPGSQGKKGNRVLSSAGSCKMEVPSAFLLSCFNWLWNHEFQWSFCFVFTSGRQLLKSLSKSELFIQHCLCIPSTLTSEKYE